MAEHTMRRGDPQATRLSEPNDRVPPRSPPKVRCRFAQVSDSEGAFTEEISCLLRTRLRLAIAIVVLGMGLHFLRQLFFPALSSETRAVYLIISGSEILLMAITLGFLWSPLPIGIKNLRIIEAVIFAMIAAFFAWIQADLYHDRAVLNAVVAGNETMIFRLLGISNALRWFLLIVLYGTFIPNTWQRCAAVVGALALIPIVMMVIGSQIDRNVGPFILSAFPEVVILMATAVAIAVFGSHKIRQLQEQAHEAQRVGQYRLKRVLGFGGMGAVYLAEHVLLRRPCAVKLIRPDQAGDPRALLRFEREVQTTATLTHWNTIEIFDYGHTDDGTFYYVMEYLPGMNLEDIIEQHGPMPPERAVHFVRQVCQALREAHGIGLIHRDIKPSNIFASERGKVYDVAKLLDFGLVKSIGLGNHDARLTQEGSLGGSPAFMSPEQAAGKQDLDARSDIYNVGAVAYFLITGELVFERDTALQMLHAHAYEALVLPEKFQRLVPADLQKVILHCLEKDPNRRYQDVSEVDRALAACECAGQWTMDHAATWWQRLPNGKPQVSPAEERERNRQTIGT